MTYLPKGAFAGNSRERINGAPHKVVARPKDLQVFQAIRYDDGGWGSVTYIVEHEFWGWPKYSTSFHPPQKKWAKAAVWWILETTLQEL